MYSQTSFTYFDLIHLRKYLANEVRQHRYQIEMVLVNMYVSVSSTSYT